MQPAARWQKVIIKGQFIEKTSNSHLENLFSWQIQAIMTTKYSEELLYASQKAEKSSLALPIDHLTLCIISKTVLIFKLTISQLSNALSFYWYKIVLSSKNGNLLKITMAFMFDALQSSGDYFASIFGPKKIMHLRINLL